MSRVLGVLLALLVLSTFAVSSLAAESPLDYWQVLAMDRAAFRLKTIALMVVSLPINVWAPLAPNRVWVEPPPKTAPMSAPLPDWSRTMRIRKMHTSTCNIASTVYIPFLRAPGRLPGLV